MVLVAAGVWLLVAARRERLSDSAAPPPAGEPVQGPARAAAPAVARARDAGAPSLVADDGLPFADPGPVDSHDGGLVHPHPITPERERIQHENQLIGAMNDAMDLGDGPKLRIILNRYRDEYPEDPNQLQEGYRIVADCLEHPGLATRAAGQRYYDRERGSILRLFVGRHCLESHN